MSNSDIDQWARIVWDYMRMHQMPVKSDAVFCLCSHDTRVAYRAADLMMQGFGSRLIISGGAGKLTEDIFDKPEAEIFKDIIVEQGVEPASIIIEPKSTNTGENVRFTYKLLSDLGIIINSFVLVQKPYMERRTYATFKKQWSDSSTRITVTSPELNYDEYIAEGIPKDEVINIMVGDLQRIREYPKLGYQIEQSIPDSVWQAYENLVAVGFTKYLLGS